MDTGYTNLAMVKAIREQYFTVTDDTHAVTFDAGTGLVSAERDLRQDRHYQPTLLNMRPPSEHPPGKKTTGPRP